MPRLSQKNTNYEDMVHFAPAQTRLISRKSASNKIGGFAVGRDRSGIPMGYFEQPTWVPEQKARRQSSRLAGSMFSSMPEPAMMERSISQSRSASASPSRSGSASASVSRSPSRSAGTKSKGKKGKGRARKGAVPEQLKAYHTFYMKFKAAHEKMKPRQAMKEAGALWQKMKEGKKRSKSTSHSKSKPKRKVAHKKK